MDEDETLSNYNPFATLAQPHAHRHDADDRSWETGFKLKISEFTSGLDPCEFLDWVNTVEDLLDFKSVPDHRRVPLVATDENHPPLRRKTVDH